MALLLLYPFYTCSMIDWCSKIFQKSPMTQLVSSNWPSIFSAVHLHKPFSCSRSLDWIHSVFISCLCNPWYQITQIVSLNEGLWVSVPGTRCAQKYIALYGKIIWVTASLGLASMEEGWQGAGAVSRTGADRRQQIAQIIGRQRIICHQWGRAFKYCWQIL